MHDSAASRISVSTKLSAKLVIYRCAADRRRMRGCEDVTVFGTAFDVDVGNV